MTSLGRQESLSRGTDFTVSHILLAFLKIKMYKLLRLSAPFPLAFTTHTKKFTAKSHMNFKNNPNISTWTTVISQTRISSTKKARKISPNSKISNFLKSV